MKKLKHILVLLGLMAFGLLSNPLNAQISEGGTPPSFAYPNAQLQKKSAAIQPTFNVEQLKAEDKQREEANGLVRVAMIIPADLSIEKSGEWTTLPDGQQIWRLNISSPGAIALTLYYDEFFIPEGGKLFIYNEARTHVIGAYTNRTNPEVSAFATELVAGDNITLEYVAPKHVYYALGEGPRIKISGIAYGYNHLDVYHLKNGAMSTYYGTAGACMVNMNCSPEGDNWQDEKKGVAKTLTPIGSGSWLCSGTIVNNTAQDLTPYYLTAHHCFYDDANQMPTAAQWNQMLYYFHYETPGCVNPAGDPVGQAKTMTGAQLLVNLPINGSSDGALLRLNQDIPLEWGVYYNGWDRTNPAGGFTTGGVGIHHPDGDVKKISTWNTATSAGPISFTGGAVTAPNGHWGTIFVATPNGHSVTEGGSSGSPLFNSDKRVIGTLSGGNSSCTNLSGNNYYGKLSHHWASENIANAATTMSTYLDPIGSGVEVLDGTYVQNNTPAANFNASSTNIYALQSVTYTDYSSMATTWEWTFEGGEPASFEGKVPPAVAYNTAGTYTTTLTINKGLPEEDTNTKTITVTLKGGTPVAPVANFAIDDGTVWKEGFDKPVNVEADLDIQLSYPGWTVTTVGASANKWRVGNATNAEFIQIDPTSAFSVLVPYDITNVIDSWLISPEMTIPTGGAKIDFYAAYASYYLPQLTFHVIVNGVTSAELWTNQYEVGGDFGMGWRGKQTVDLSAYEGQDVQLAWRYYGATNLLALDGIRLHVDPDPNKPTTLYVGEYISPIDLSTGPPVLYEWTFDGGEPATSTVENPEKVQYNTVGTYDISLRVKNTEGEDTRTFEGAVVVQDRPVIPQFEAMVDGGYTLTSFGPFAPEKAQVEFADKSGNHPTAWEWTFDGGEPASSTEQNPGVVTYQTPGSFDLKLKVSNTAGEEELVVTDFAKIGYDIPGNIWNVMAGESPEFLYNMLYWGILNVGYMTGTNSWDIRDIAEKFEAPEAPGIVSSVDILFEVFAPYSGTATLPVYIMSDANGLPGSILAQSSINVADIVTGEYNTVTFDTPAVVGGAFYVAVGGFNSSAYNLAIPTVETRADGYNTVYQYDAYYGTWSDTYTEWGVATSMGLSAEFTYITFDVEGETEFYRKNIDTTVGTVSVATHEDVAWTATPMNSWIAVSNASGTGNGSFTFTVKDNTARDRKGLVKVVAGSIERYVVVHQAGPQPIELMAVPNSENEDEVMLTWEAPKIKEPYQPGSDIFDDIEEHIAWTINSAGEFGWQYIDGDGGTPYSIIDVNGTTYPYSNNPGSFRVYNPSLTTPAITGAAFVSHSGMQYFACPSNTAGVVNNDWLISPVLSFSSDFTFSFWAKSLNNTYGLERMKVAYSTTGMAQGDFTVITTGSYVEVPTAWTKYTYTIPANAKYVAINCVSNDAMMLMVDDIFVGTGVAPASAYEAQTEAAADGSAVKVAPIFGRSNASKQPKTLNGRSVSKSDRSIIDAKTGKKVDVSGAESRKLEIHKGVAPVSTDDEFTTQAALPTIKMGYSNGTPSGNAIGVAVGADIEVAMRFTPADLISKHNAKIKAVDVYLMNEPVDGITLNIRSGNEIIHSQKVTSIVTGKFMRIALDKEVRINATNDLYIGYAFTQKPNDGSNNYYVPAVDAGPAAAGKGDLISLLGSPFESMAALGLNFNWVLFALVDDNSVLDLSYKVYRDGEAIAEGVEGEVYSDFSATQRTSCYEVAAVYSEFGLPESTTSNTACVTLKSVLTLTVADATRYVTEANPDFEITVTGDLLPGDTYANIISQCEAECLANEQSAPGTYPITIKPVANSDYRFVYEHGTLTVMAAPALSEVAVLTATAENYIDVALEWTAVTDAVSYVVYRDGVELTAVTTLTYTDSGLADGEYCYTVKGVSSLGGESDLSNEACATIENKLSETPVLTATAENDQNVALEWTAVTDAVSYVVYRNGVELTAVTTLTYTDSGLTSGVYCYTVKGVSSLGGESDLSNEACATIVNKLGETPVLTATVVSSWNAKLDWTTPTRAVSYKVYRGSDLIATVNTNTYTDNTLGAGSYCYVIIAADAYGIESNPSNQACVTIASHSSTQVNAFTPYERDGINDIFLPGAKIEVVNRYGQSIFNGSNGWDGTRKNKELVSPGTYYYKATLPDGSVKRGSVEVIKKK